MKFKCFRYIQDTGDPNWWVRSRENSPHHGQAEEGFSWSVAWEKFADGRRTSKGAQCCRHPISERAPKAKVKFNGRIIMIQITYEPLKREISNQFTSWAPLTSIDRLLHYCQYLVSKHPPPIQDEIQRMNYHASETFRSTEIRNRKSIHLLTSTEIQRYLAAVRAASVSEQAPNPRVKFNHGCSYYKSIKHIWNSDPWARLGHNSPRSVMGINNGSGSY